MGVLILLNRYTLEERRYSIQFLQPSPAQSQSSTILPRLLCFTVPKLRGIECAAMSADVHYRRAPALAFPS